MAIINTNIPYNNKYANILSSVIGQMSDGIWENTRSMEKYWRSLSFERNDSGNICIIDRNNVCSNPAEFMANKIKQIIKIEIEDTPSSRMTWERTCRSIPSYMHGNVTVGDCYQLYELLKGRSGVSDRHYATMDTYSVDINFYGTIIHMSVEATNPNAAKDVAFKKLQNEARVHVEIE